MKTRSKHLYFCVVPYKKEWKPKAAGVKFWRYWRIN